MEQFEDDIERIREHGISLGLSDKEIDLCISNAMQLEYMKQQDGAKAKAQTSARKAKNNTAEKRLFMEHLCLGIIFLKWCSVLLICLAVIYNGVFLHEPTHKLLEKQFQHYSYSCLRIARLITFPFVKNMHLQELYEADCILPNPLQIGEPPFMDCTVCRDIWYEKRSRKDGFNADIFSREYYNGGTPVLIQDGDDMIANFADIQRIYSKHQSHVDKGKNVIFSSDENIKSIKYLAENVTDLQIKVDTFFHTEWHANLVGPSRALRKLFPRPYFIPSDSEVVMSKVVLIDAPKAYPYMVPRPLAKNAWYVQASGSRKLILVPNEYCANDCQEIQVTMLPGQILYIHDPVWTMDSIPIFGEDAFDQPSIAFVGAFN